MKTLRWFGLWAPVFAFMALAFFLSSRSSIVGLEYVWDKALHAAAYLVFGALCLRAFHGGVRGLRRRSTAWALLLALSHGLFEELHQAFVPGRVASVLDWTADALGAVLSVPFVALLARLSGDRKSDREGR